LFDGGKGGTVTGLSGDGICLEIDPRTGAIARLESPMSGWFVLSACWSYA
jgi:hypothetical protein